MCFLEPVLPSAALTSLLHELFDPLLLHLLLGSQLCLILRGSKHLGQLAVLCLPYGRRLTHLHQLAAGRGQDLALLHSVRVENFLYKLKFPNYGYIRGQNFYSNT